MLVIPGRAGNTCDGPTRRELFRAGSLGIAGLNLAQFFAWRKTASAADKYTGARGFGAAKSVMFIFLQGGPSHIDIWDPEAGCARKHPRRLQAHQDEDSGHADQRNHAHDGRACWISAR